MREIAKKSVITCHDLPYHPEIFKHPRPIPSEDLFFKKTP